MRLAHGRIEIELHQLARGDGRALLLLHQLYASAAAWGEGFAAWPGPVWALDFAGHGPSQRIKGGAYTPEILACDVDATLRHIGLASLVGAGVGAYVALLVAGARPDAVPSALLLPGAGLDGGGDHPDFTRPPRSLVDRAVPRADCDPMLCFLESDVRPVDYTTPFAREARQLVLLDDGTPRPSWWRDAAQAERATEVADLASGLAAL